MKIPAYVGAFGWNIGAGGFWVSVDGYLAFGKQGIDHQFFAFETQRARHERQRVLGERKYPESVEFHFPRIELLYLAFKFRADFSDIINQVATCTVAVNAGPHGNEIR